MTRRTVALLACLALLSAACDRTTTEVATAETTTPSTTAGPDGTAGPGSSAASTPETPSPLGGE